MDKQFQVDADTFFSERHSNILVKFRKENQNHSELMGNIANTQELIKSQVPETTWLLIKRLIGLINLQNHIESKQLYAQGIKDCVYLMHFLDVEYINLSFNDL